MFVNFDLATDPNIDHVLTQLRYAQAESQLPAEVRNLGVTVQKSLSAPFILVALSSPGGTHDAEFLFHLAPGASEGFLIVPAGFTGDRLPVGVSFLGRAFSEPSLLALGYSFEQATKARRRPVHTPALPGEAVTVP